MHQIKFEVWKTICIYIFIAIDRPKIQRDKSIQLYTHQYKFNILT